MDDNATCHRTLAVQDCLDSEGIQRLVWPARSPDLNPIENVWDALGRQVAGRNYPPTNKNTFIHALTEEWDKLSQQLLDNVVQRTLLLMFKELDFSINAQRYAQTLDTLLKAIKDKFPGMLSSGVIILLNNTRLHFTKLCVEAHKMWEFLEHPVYTPDLSPWDYHIFGALKKGLIDP
ncbi:transposable element Tcb2 transposase [Trichonephila clavipes]|nr:transposable element Tcb2 transposase [Trichonephila clavipes]